MTHEDTDQSAGWFQRDSRASKEMKEGARVWMVLANIPASGSAGLLVLCLGCFSSRSPPALSHPPLLKCPFSDLLFRNYFPALLCSLALGHVTRATLPKEEPSQSYWGLWPSFSLRHPCRMNEHGQKCLHPDLNDRKWSGAKIQGQGVAGETEQACVFQQDEDKHRGPVQATGEMEWARKGGLSGHSRQLQPGSTGSSPLIPPNSPGQGLP